MLGDESWEEVFLFVEKGLERFFGDGVKWM